MPSTGVSAPTSLGAMVKSFERSLFVQNKAALTVKSHRDALRLLAELLAERGMPTGVETISREHVEEFLADQLRRWKPATAHARYVSTHLAGTAGALLLRVKRLGRHV